MQSSGTVMQMVSAAYHTGSHILGSGTYLNSDPLCRWTLLHMQCFCHRNVSLRCVHVPLLLTHSGGICRLRLFFSLGSPVLDGSASVQLSEIFTLWALKLFTPRRQKALIILVTCPTCEGAMHTREPPNVCMCMWFIGSHWLAGFADFPLHYQLPFVESPPPHCRCDVWEIKLHAAPLDAKL